MDPRNAAAVPVANPAKSAVVPPGIITKLSAVYDWLTHEEIKHMVPGILQGNHELLSEFARDYPEYLVEMLIDPDVALGVVSYGLKKLCQESPAFFKEVCRCGLWFVEAIYGTGLAIRWSDYGWIKRSEFIAACNADHKLMRKLVTCDHFTAARYFAKGLNIPLDMIIDTMNDKDKAATFSIDISSRGEEVMKICSLALDTGISDEAAIQWVVALGD